MFIFVSPVVTTPIVGSGIGVGEKLSSSQWVPASDSSFLFYSPETYSLFNFCTKFSKRQIVFSNRKITLCSMV